MDPTFIGKYLKKLILIFLAVFLCPSHRILLSTRRRAPPATCETRFQQTVYLAIGFDLMWCHSIFVIVINNSIENGTFIFLFVVGTFALTNIMASVNRIGGGCYVSILFLSIKSRVIFKMKSMDVLPMLNILLFIIFFYYSVGHWPLFRISFGVWWW